jgi:hypothetical protein
MKHKSLILLVIFILSLAGLTVQASEAQTGAPCYQTARLWVGGSGRVTTTPNLPNRIRSYPAFNAGVQGYIPAGSSFSIIGGPYCESGVQWWQVNYNGRVGWTAEGDGAAIYWLEPIAYNPPSACVLPTRLAVGGQGRVIPGDPNIVRSAPGTQSSGAASVVLGSMPGGTVFNVLGGPACGPDGRWWWFVDGSNGAAGWTAEGEGYSNYWLEPWGVTTTICQGFLPSRLSEGGWGRVSDFPPLPNNVRSSSSYYGGVLGQIPVGGVFQVIDGPICTEDTAWWYVNYNGLAGWTVEGNGSTYWLEPY